MSAILGRQWSAHIASSPPSAWMQHLSTPRGADVGQEASMFLSGGDNASHRGARRSLGAAAFLHPHSYRTVACEH